MNHHLKVYDMVISSAVDIIVILVLALSIILGFFRGFLGQILRLFSWLGAAYATYYIYFNHKALLPNLDPLIVLGVLFIGALILFKIIQFIIEHVLKSYGFKIIDQPLGLAFGIVRAIALVFFLKPVLDTFKVESPFLTYAQNHLRTYPAIKKSEDYVQEKFQEKFKECLEKMEKEFKKH